MLVDAGQKMHFNATFRFDRLGSLTAPAQPTDRGVVEHYGPLALMLASSADDNVHVYIVKSDAGTIDGAQVLPQTTTSTEFFIVSWK